eukprot:gene18542-biopygen15623
MAWRHVPTSVNPADIGSRGETKLQEKELWIKGPTWLSTPEQWPPMIACEQSSESESEKRLMKQIMQTAIVRESDEIDRLIDKKSFWQSLRILAWMKRFIENCKRVKAKRLTSPLTTDEIEQQKRFLTKRVQSDAEANLQFENERAKLNLQKDSDGIYRSMPDPPPGNLPRERTEDTMPFDVVGVDFAGPIQYKKGTGINKAYIILYTCSLTRGLHLEVLPDMTTEEFLASFKRFIAARGRPSKIISDNGKTFVASAKWVKRIRKSEKLQGYMAEQEMKWQFNLSRASWWGGWFARMVSIVKAALHKIVGAANKELQDAILEIQLVLNNRPLTYCEDDIELPTLTPNMLIFGKSNYLPLENPSDIDDKDLRKRARYLRKCKDALWKRWQGEYLRALRERHNVMHKVTQRELEIGDVVTIKGDEKNRGQWKIGIVEELIQGRDGIVRAVKLRAGKSHLERPIQFLYPLELHCDRAVQSDIKMNPEAGSSDPNGKRL